MLIGYNNDVEYRGKAFHIQTEDHGENDPKIESQVFHQGQILDTEVVSYVSIVKRHDDEEVANEKIKSLMWKTHKGLYERLLSGEYDERVGLDPVDDEEIDAPDPEEFNPGQDRVPTAARVVEEKGEEAFEQFHEQEAQKHVDLHSLKDQLDEDETKGVESDEVDADASSPDEHLPEVPIASIESVEGEDDDANRGETVETRADGGSEAESDSGAPLGDDSQLSDLEDAADLAHLDPSSDELDGEDDASGVRSQTASKSLKDDLEPTGESPGPTEQRETAPLGRERSASPSGGRSSVSASSDRDDLTASSSSREDSDDDAPLPTSTGATAWRGCKSPDGALSLVPLVESFLDE